MGGTNLANTDWGYTSNGYIGNYGDMTLLWFKQYEAALTARNAGTTLTAAQSYCVPALSGTNVSAAGYNRWGCFRSCRPTWRTARCRRCRGWSRRICSASIQRAPPNWGAWYVEQVLGGADLEPRGLGQDGVHPQLRRERRLLRPCRRTDRAAERRLWSVDRQHGERNLSGQWHNVLSGPEPLRHGRARPLHGDLAMEQGRMGVQPSVRPHLGHPVHRHAFWRAGAAYHPVACRGVRRPDGGIELRGVRRDGGGICRAPRPYLSGPTGTYPNQTLSAITTASISGNKSPASFSISGQYPTTPTSLTPQEPGQRLARPLPYQCQADATVGDGRSDHQLQKHRSGGFILPCAQRRHGQRHQQLWPRHGGDGDRHKNSGNGTGPWGYTVDPATQALSDTFTPATSSYDLSVYSANGFFRRFAGTIGGDNSGGECRL